MNRRQTKNWRRRCTDIKTWTGLNEEWSIYEACDKYTRRIQQGYDREQYQNAVKTLLETHDRDRLGHPEEEPLHVCSAWTTFIKLNITPKPRNEDTLDI